MEKMLSVIIPSRTADYILDECILKIRELYKELRIIIILDSSSKIPSEKYDQNVLFLRSENKNMSAKRNLGVKNATTKYIALLDSDAYPAAGWLENGIEFLEKSSDYSAVTGLQYNPESDNFVQRCLRLVRFSNITTHHSWQIITDSKALPRDCSEFSSANVIMRKSVYESVNGMNENFYLAEDNEFSQRLVQQGYKIRFIPGVSVFHRESKMYPFLRKHWCMSYYYANMFVKRTPVKTLKQTIIQFLPLIGFISFIFLWISFLYIKANPFPLLILPVGVIYIFAKEAYNLTKKLENRKIAGFFIIFYTFCAFSAIWIVASFAGIISFPSKNVKDLYKHY